MGEVRVRRRELDSRVAEVRRPEQERRLGQVRRLERVRKLVLGRRVVEVGNSSQLEQRIRKEGVVAAGTEVRIHIHKEVVEEHNRMEGVVVGGTGVQVRIRKEEVEAAGTGEQEQERIRNRILGRWG